jgi:hypothetical protein
VLGAETNPVATGRVVPQGDHELADLDITATSDDESIVTDDNIAIEVGEDNSFTLSATPASTGDTILSLTSTVGDEEVATSTLNYWVSDAIPDD